jgi:hypothetical protein
VRTRERERARERERELLCDAGDCTAATWLLLTLSNAAAGGQEDTWCARSTLQSQARRSCWTPHPIYEPQS